MYKTGDLVRWLPTGEIEFGGRIDTQVKIRGYRIELGAIEAVMYERKDIREVVVIAREDIPGDKRLVAYYVLQDGEVSPEVSSIKNHINEKLPEFMVPSAFVELESMPLTANHKIDRRVLPAPTFDDGGGDYVAPRDPVETAVAKVFAETLGIARIMNWYADFFEMGGHSLSAARAISRLEKLFEARVALSSIYTSRSVSALAKILRSPSRLRKRVVRKNVDKSVVSYNEKSLWFLTRVWTQKDGHRKLTIFHLLHTLIAMVLIQLCLKKLPWL